MKTYSTIILLFCCLFSSAQVNLVPNPSFEEENPSRPSRTFTHGGYPFRPLITPWYLPTKGTSDYFNSDQSNFYLSSPVKTAHTGEGRIGLVAGSGNPKEKTAEYIQVKLTAPLQKDSLYCITMHFSLDKRARFYAPSLGIALGSTTLTDTGATPLIRQPEIICNDKAKTAAFAGWQSHSQVYKARGGEQYLTLGQFDTITALPVPKRKVPEPIPQNLESFSGYAYYYFDDISVVGIHTEKDCSPALAETVRPPENYFVFVVDVSASMFKAGYLQELKTALQQLTDTLGDNDLVSIVAFDARTRIVLRSVRASEKQRIVQAIAGLQAGTTTNVDKALSRAYEMADSTFIYGNNKLVLVSDAQFDISSTSSALIKDHYKNRQVNFSMVQFGAASNRELKKITAATKGVYVSAASQDIAAVLNTQVKKQKPRQEYTPQRKGFTWEQR